jgi:hypothetical protein
MLKPTAPADAQINIAKFNKSAIAPSLTSRSSCLERRASLSCRAKTTLTVEQSLFAIVAENPPCPSAFY